MKIHGLTLLPVLAVTLGLLSSCNVFDPLDTPTSDAQLLSAARACFDQGDIACAQDNYSKLSGSQSDVANSELAFALLDQQGASMSSFMVAFGSGGSGQAFTKLANSLAGGAGLEKRMKIYAAYKKNEIITGTPPLRGLVRFITSLTMVSELLAEGATGGLLKQSDLAVNPTNCKATSPVAIGLGTATDCNMPPGSSLANGTGTFDPITDSTSLASGNPTLVQIFAFISQITAGLNEIGATGKFSSGTGALTQAFAAMTLAQGGPVALNGEPFRLLLLKQNFGD